MALLWHGSLPLCHLIVSYCRSRSNGAHVSWTETSQTEENRDCFCYSDGRVTYSAFIEDPDLSLLPSVADLSTLPSFPSWSKTAILLPDLKCQGGIYFLIHHLHSSVYFVCSIRYNCSNFYIAVIQCINSIEGRVYLGLQLQRGSSPSPPWQGAWQRTGRNDWVSSLKFTIRSTSRRQKNTMGMA